MAIDLCDVEETLRCNPSLGDELFKNLAIRALLNLTTAVNAISVGPGGGGVEGVGVIYPQVIKTAAQVQAAAAYTSLGMLDVTKKIIRLYIDNKTDADIEISLDGGTTTAFTVFANSFLTRNLGAYVGAATTSLMFRKKSGQSATVGDAYFDGSY